MVALQTRRQVSLDTNFVLDLAREEDFAHELRETLLGKNYGLALSPAAVFEMHVIHAHSAVVKEREWARIALLGLKKWGIQPFDMDSTSEAVAEEFARRLLHLGLIPPDELDDGLILAQTSLVHIPLLVTSDKHLLDISEDDLSLAFNAADLFPVHPIHPRRLLRALR